MHTRRVHDEPSEISVSSSKYKRRISRASVLKNVIYLKRRCIRCYFVSFIFALVELAIHGITLYRQYHLIRGQADLYYSLLMYIGATIGMVVGSGICIYAMSKKLVIIAFIVGKVLMTLSVAMIGIAFICPGMIPHDPETNFGYPIDLIEDCGKFPDHTFAIVISPTRKKGPPYGNESDPDPDRHDAGGVVALADAELFSSTTEAYVTESYPCREMVTNVNWFELLYECMLALLIVVSVTVTLSYVGIIHLYWIHKKGLDYSILPPTLVEPYTSYDELMRRNHSLTSIPSEISILYHPVNVDIDEQRELYRKANRVLNIDVGQLDHGARGKAVAPS